MRNEYLEAQIHDAVEKYKKEEGDLQVGYGIIFIYSILIKAFHFSF